MAAPAMAAAERSRSASASTSEAFWPPISHWPAAPRSTSTRATPAPVAAEPVNDSAATPGCPASAAPASP